MTNEIAASHHLSYNLVPLTLYGAITITYSCVQGGWTALMFACDEGHSAIVAELLSCGADVQLCTHQVYNLTYVATRSEDHKPCMQSGLSPLMLATNNGHLETVKLLLNANAPVDYGNKVS